MAVPVGLIKEGIKIGTTAAIESGQAVGDELKQIKKEGAGKTEVAYEVFLKKQVDF